MFLKQQLNFKVILGILLVAAFAIFMLNPDMALAGANLEKSADGFISFLKKGATLIQYLCFFMAFVCVLILVVSLMNKDKPGAQPVTATRIIFLVVAAAIGAGAGSFIAYAKSATLGDDNKVVEMEDNPFGS